jgi:hypothetical protein
VNGAGARQLSRMDGHRRLAAQPTRPAASRLGRERATPRTSQIAREWRSGGRVACRSRATDVVAIACRLAINAHREAPTLATKLWPGCQRALPQKVAPAEKRPPRNDESPAGAGLSSHAPNRTRTSTRLSRTMPSTLPVKPSGGAGPCCRAISCPAAGRFGPYLTTRRVSRRVSRNRSVAGRSTVMSRPRKPVEAGWPHSHPPRPGGRRAYGGVNRQGARFRTDEQAAEARQNGWHAECPIPRPPARDCS